MITAIVALLFVTNVLVLTCFQLSVSDVSREKYETYFRLRIPRESPCMSQTEIVLRNVHTL